MGRSDSAIVKKPEISYAHCKERISFCFTGWWPNWHEGRLKSIDWLTVRLCQDKKNSQNFGSGCFLGKPGGQASRFD